MSLRFAEKVLSAVTTGASAAKGGPDLSGVRETVMYAVFSAGVGAGAVQLETAPTKDYTGTWSPIGSPLGFAVSSAKHISNTGILGAIRARVSTDVTGGTVDVWLFGEG